MIYKSLPFYTAIALISQLAFAAEPQSKKVDQTSLLMEETIVTADFRDTQLMDTVGSITVVNKAAVQERAAQHLESILNAIPNLSWSAGGSRSRFLQVRGVGDMEQFGDPKYYPSVGIMVDDLELGDAASASMLFDVDQVEVLRGPQGMRFGASAHAGMVKINTQAPTDHFEGSVSAGVGNYDSYNAGLVLSGPLTKSLTARLALQTNQGDGYTDNQYLDKDDTNGFDELTGRIKLQWSPSDNAQYDFALFSFNSDNGYDAWSLENNRKTQSDNPGSDNQETLALTAKGNWQLNDNHSLQLIGSRSESDLYYGYDLDWINPDFCVTYICSGYVYTAATESYTRTREKTTLDLRLLGGNDALNTGEWHYAVGLYANNSNEKLDSGSLSTSHYDTERYALYAEVDVAASERWTITVGIRAEKFQDDYRDTNAYASDSSDNLWSSELSAKYQINDNSMAYATIVRGQKPGGVNTSASADQPRMSPAFQTFTQDKLSFDSEILLNKEIGLKTLLLNQRLSINAALFHTDRDNAQLENWMWDDMGGLNGLWIGYLDSTSDASNYGAELETRFDVTNSLQLFASLAWLETNVDSIATFDQDEWDFVVKTARDQSKSPNYQYNLGARLKITSKLSTHIEMEGQDVSYYGYYHDGKIDSYNLINASLNWSNGVLQINIWGRNLADKNYATHGLYAPADPRDNYGAWANTSYHQFGEPRSYGVNISYAF